MNSARPKALLSRGCLSILFLIYTLSFHSQTDTTVKLTFDFNDHTLNEKNNKAAAKGVGIVLSADRFGNEKSAIYTQGHNSSYLTLESSPLLKSHIMSISMWVNLERRVYEGKGFDFNPLLITKNAPGEDFVNAFAIGYQGYGGRLGINSSKDSTMSVQIEASKPLQFNTWYHLVYICTDDYLAFYLNGELQSKVRKEFCTQFLSTDSITIGHSASRKNLRFSMGSFDDIRFFHKPLSEQEVYDLYHAPNPNKTKNLINELLKYGSVILVLVAIIVLLIIRNKRNLKKQKEQFQLVNRITELELKVVKAQINPHFISNCLAAIQELIYDDVDKAGQYIAKFSYFLRQVLNYSDKNYITLSEELEIIRLNVELEKLRFKDQFIFSMEVSEDVDSDQLVPALISQPFIENAIWHGLLPLNGRRRATLKVSVRLKENRICLEIEDNGIGRDLVQAKESSKGMKLVLDKIDTLNRLSKDLNHRIGITDLKSGTGEPVGTKVIILIDTVKE